VPYIADMKKATAFKDAGQLVGNGQCVTFVHAVVYIPQTSHWERGGLVMDDHSIQPGTVIATFDDDGTYGNHTNHTSHAAIYLYQTTDGIVVMDQWKGAMQQWDHPPKQRTIHFHRDHTGFKVDDGTQYHVVD
jgi:hypothetical protein